MKQPVLLLHGAISSQKQFQALASLLNEWFEVHTFDFPGHGGKEIPEEFSIRGFAESVLEYIDNKNLIEVSIFGYSMGGYIALYLAKQHSQWIKKIFTLATKIEWTEAFALKETAQLNPEKISDKVPAFAAVLKEIHAPQDWKKVLEKTSAMLLHLGKTPELTEDEFRQIKIPVIISVGELDKMVSIDESGNAVRSLQNGQLLVLPSTPHPFEKVDLQMLSRHMKDFFC